MDIEDSIQLPHHFLIHFLTQSPMVTFILDDIVENKVGLPLITQPMSDFRTQW